MALRRRSASDIQVVATNDGKGVCVVCGNGLWPGQAPCEHKIAAARERDQSEGNDG